MSLARSKLHYVTNGGEVALTSPLPGGRGGEEDLRRFLLSALKHSEAAAMDGLNPDCWVRSARPPLCLLPQHPGSLVMQREEEEEEEEEEGQHPAACCCSTGCHGDVGQAVEAQWSTPRPPTLSGIPGGYGPAAGGPGAPRPRTVRDGGGRCWEGPRMETRGCVCVCGQKGAGGPAPCWPGCPYVYGVRRNLVVALEVVEEVAVEDTLEVIGHIHT
uniref:uncharacterized protein LOC120810270 isoform X2 n=1 Tax=Gasterosteus aculeatus aculeatus TaxID=481459 RepID=UPI001A99BDFB|nr:uncharacterized protein LOC120810270 isoform X2 [Gasterosteus aculeatus aculeatus]